MSIFDVPGHSGPRSSPALTPSVHEKGNQVHPPRRGSPAPLGSNWCRRCPPQTKQRATTVGPQSRRKNRAPPAPSSNTTRRRRRTPYGDWINDLPTAFFLVVHIAAFAVGAGFAWVAYKRDLGALGTGFALYAAAEGSST